MTTQIKSIVIVLVFSVTSLTQAATYGGGSGTTEDPYQICTAEQMNAIGTNASDWNKHFILTATIDFEGATITPIAPDTDPSNYGFQGTTFMGMFDGGGHVLRNFVIDQPASDYVGLFGQVGSGGRIRNLGVEPLQVTGRYYVGGLCGRNWSGTITSCYATGAVSGYESVGGLCGYNYSTITSCYATGTVSGYSTVGGLCGYNYDTITSCYATGAVSGTFDVGGLCGNNGYGTISTCYATGTVSGTFDVGGLCGHNGIDGDITSCYAAGTVTGSPGYSDYVGGLCGVNSGGTITSCYATGTVSGTYDVGGLCGMSSGGTITSCYATGIVSGTSEVGGLCGWNSGTINDSFWDTQTSGWPTSDGGTGKTTAQMQTRSTFTSAGWDFTVIDGDPFDWWMLVKSYPHLYWEPYYGGGSGTAEDPYQIWTAEQMNTIGLNAPDWNKHFKLMADIDMSIYTGTQYNIIGNSDTKFTGALNGNEHAIRNLAYTTGNAVDCIGLLGRIENAFIQNLSLENVSLSSGGKNIGGLVGWNDSSTLSACYMSGSVNGIGHVGGLVGRNDSGSLTACHAAGSVNGTNAIGGLAGGNYSGSLENCYATGSVSGTGNYVGGVIGYNTKGKLTACYAAGSVAETGTRIGGLAGWNSADSTVTACFWDTLASGTSNGVGGGSSSGITGKTTAEMRMLSTFTDAGWDFTNEILNGTNDIWRMCTNDIDYPRLNWESIVGDFSCPDGVNTEDLTYYTSHWLMNNCSSSNNYCGGTDLNYSGVIDLADWTIFAGNWLSEI